MGNVLQNVDVGRHTSERRLLPRPLALSKARIALELLLPRTPAAHFGLGQATQQRPLWPWASLAAPFLASPAPAPFLASHITTPTLGERHCSADFGRTTPGRRLLAKATTTPTFGDTIQGADFWQRIIARSYK